MEDRVTVLSQHTGFVSHPPHLIGASEIWCWCMLGAEVYVLSLMRDNCGLMHDLPAGELWLDFFDIGDVSSESSLSSWFIAIRISVRIPSLLYVPASGTTPDQLCFMESTWFWKQPISLSPTINVPCSQYGQVAQYNT